LEKEGEQEGNEGVFKFPYGKNNGWVRGFGALASHYGSGRRPLGLLRQLAIPYFAPIQIPLWKK